MTNSRGTLDNYSLLFRPLANPRVRLFCFPYAGVGAAMYAAWRRLLPVDIEVCPVQLPGRENRIGEPPFETLEPLVDELRGALVSYLGVPYVFFGHSLGSLIAYEVARALRRESRPLPRHLFLSGCRAPHLPNSRPPVHHLPDDLFVDAIRQRYDGIPSPILDDEDAMQLFTPLLKADFSIFDRYRYATEPPLECPISCFGARDDSSVTEEQLRAWEEHTCSAFSFHWLPGDHFNVRSEAERIVQVITESVGGS